VGGKRAVRVDIRLISATNRSLLDLVKQGKFREDLYYRLNVFPMTLPPLRARREDIPDLVRSFCARFAAEEGKRLRGITAEAMALLSRYPWPGNVRQLENALFRAVVLADGDELTVAEFPQIAAQVEGFDVRIPPLPSQAALPAGGLEPVREIVRVEVRDPHAMSLVVEDTGDMKTMEAVEAEVIRFALQFYRGRMSEVSRRLGIGRSTLYRKLKELGLDEEERSEDAA
jgi:DNA-binding NtrC family response regulator